MSDFLATDPEHGGVTDEMLEQFFADNPTLRPLAPIAEQTGVPPVGDADTEPSAPPTTPEPATEEPGEGEPPETTEPSAEPEPPAETPEEGAFYEFDGQRYPASQVEAAARFQSQLVNDPQLQLLIRNYLAGGVAAESAPPASPVGEGSAPTGPPIELDLDDPQIRALYGVIQQQQERLDGLQFGLNASVTAQQMQQRNTVNAALEVAQATFAKDHNLKPEDMHHLSQVAARMNVIPSLLSGIDPITGAPSTPDYQVAFGRAFEIAMNVVPEYRDREFRRSVQTQQDDAKKRKLLGAVGGSSGSVARTTPPPRPGSPEAKRQMLAEVGSMMDGNWSDPTAN